jgi:predicted phage terminase large subunit-like protein
VTVIPTPEQIDRALSEKSLAEFSKLAWPIVEPSTPLMWGWHLDAIAEHLEAVTAGQIRNLLIAVPPGHMKSLLTGVFWPAWAWTTRPDKRWLFASYAAPLAIRDSVKCRRVIESSWYQRLWGDRFSLTGDQNAKVKFENDATGFRLSTSVDGSATGERTNFVIADDPHNVRQRESEAKRTGVIDWWDNVYSNRLADYRSDCRVVIHQRVHEKDLIGHLMGRSDYEYLCLPTEFDPSRRKTTSIGWTDPRTKAGDLLFPQRFGPKEVEEAKVSLGPSGFAGQHQQEPTPSGGGRFKEAWFRYYRRDGDVFVIPPHGTHAGFAVPVDACSRFATMDPAGTDAAQNDKACYTVIQAWALTPSFHLLLIDQYRQQVEAPDAAEAAVSFTRKHECGYIGIEKDGIGLGTVQSVRRRGITVRPIKARGSKQARSETAEIRMSAGMILFHEGAPLNFDLEHELLMFPNGEHFDQVDAMAHAAMIVNREGGPPRTPDDDAAERAAEERDQLADDAGNHPGTTLSAVGTAIATEDVDAWLAGE